MESQDKGLVHLEFFELPVYRVTHGKYLREQSELRDRATNPERIFDEQTRKVLWDQGDEKQKQEMLQMWNSSFDRSDEALPWRYNDIIGYIRLYATLGLIKGDYYAVDIKRIRRDRKRAPYKYYDKVIEFHIHAKDSQDEIAKKIIENLSNLQDSSLFKNKYIFVDLLKVLIDFIDWKRLLPIGRF